MVKLLNINTGKIGYARASDLMIPEPPRCGMYLNYDQEGMTTGAKVKIRNGKQVYTIKHINPKNLECDLSYEGLKHLIRGVPLAYLHYADPNDSEMGKRRK
jgi:hypothetical protein